MIEVYNKPTEKSKLRTLPDRPVYPWELYALLRGIRQSVVSWPKEFSIDVVDRDYLLVRLLFDTWARIHELLAVQVEHVDLGARTVHLATTKGKAVMERQGDALVHVRTDQVPRTVAVSQQATTALIRVIGPRTKGPLFQGNAGGALTARAAQKMIDLWARRISYDGKDCLQAIVQRGNKTTDYLFSPKAIREFGEWQAIHLGGMDRRSAAHQAGHTEGIQAAYYDRFADVRTIIESRRTMGELEQSMREWRGDE